MLILASSSSYRKKQLDQLLLKFKAIAPNIDEEALKNQDLSPCAISQELSLLKAKAVLKDNRESIIIGADQVLNFKDEIFSKPGNRDNAIKQLEALSGQTHELITSYALISKDKEIVESVISTMTMRKLSTKQIESYVDIDEPFYCCGSYKLETVGISLFENIVCPDHSAIIGLPLISLTTNLKSFGIEVL